MGKQQKHSVSMEEISISQFKATCLAILARVKRTNKPILVLRKGEPIAQVLPPPPPIKQQPWLGSLAGTGEIIGDILDPVSPSEEWDVFRA
ncbi:MAG: type II toxin-antitoxin system Phd/YefM family antitoxin [Nitrospira sp.]|nr:type II toxin-antitoxin system Phd/YefM family antitoxin [Nitrospira sp.]